MHNNYNTLGVEMAVSPSPPIYKKEQIQCQLKKVTPFIEENVMILRNYIYSVTKKASPVRKIYIHTGGDSDTIYILYIYINNLYIKTVSILGVTIQPPFSACNRHTKKEKNREKKMKTKKRIMIKNFFKSCIFFLGLLLVGVGLIFADLMHEQRDSEAAKTGFALFPELKGKI